MSDTASTSSPSPSPFSRFLHDWRIWQLVVLAFLFVGGCGFYTAAGLLFVVGPKTGGSGSGQAPTVDITSDEWHFRFTCKLKDWEEQRDAERELKPVLVMKRKKPSSTMVVCVHDFQGKKVDDEVLQQTTLARLKSGFKELKTGRWLKSKLGGKDAKRIDIQASDSSGDFVTGECYCVLDEDVGYIVIMWRRADTKTSLADEWEELREGIVLLGKESASR